MNYFVHLQYEEEETSICHIYIHSEMLFSHILACQEAGVKAQGQP